MAFVVRGGKFRHSQWVLLAQQKTHPQQFTYVFRLHGVCLGDGINHRFFDGVDLVVSNNLQRESESESVYIHTHTHTHTHGYPSTHTHTHTRISTHTPS